MAEHGMTWTCEQTEARLSDYLDGFLQPAEQAAFDLHVNTCDRCTPLVAGVSHVLGAMHSLVQVEPSPGLVNSILTATLGPQSWRSTKRWLRGFQSPRFVYSMASVAATFLVILTASGFSFKKPKLADLAPATIYRNADRQVHLVYARSAKFVGDLRVVYEIQSRLRQDNEIPTTPESTIPQSAPGKQPGQTDRTNPASPRQQNRADGIQRNLELLAAHFPVLSGSFGERRIP
jgi:anti-sigma factor RsiW